MFLTWERGENKREKEEETSLKSISQPVISTNSWLMGFGGGGQSKKGKGRLALSLASTSPLMEEERGAREGDGGKRKSKKSQVTTVLCRPCWCVCVFGCVFECVSGISGSILHWQQEINIGLCYWPHDLSTWISPPIRYLFLSPALTVSLLHFLPRSVFSDGAHAKTHTRARAHTHTHTLVHSLTVKTH